MTTDQRRVLVETYLRTNNIAETRMEFSRLFPDRMLPSINTIFYNVRKYQTHGTSLDRHRGSSGARRTVRNAENINLVREALQQNPRLSLRRNNTGFSRSSLNNMIRLDLRWHPYKIRRRHELVPGDLPRRMAYSQWLVRRFEDQGFIQKIIIGDEASFSMNGRVNTQTVREYAPAHQPPNFNFDVSSSREKINVWAALCGNRDIIGPFFYDNNINGQTYLNMLNEEVVPSMMEIFQYDLFGDVQFNDVLWFQDGAGAHRARAVSIRLRELFGENVIALGQRQEWPARSPDLTPCDFFLWGYLKSKVFTTPPPDVFALRMRIVDQFEAIRNNRELISRAVGGMNRRAQLCVEREGGHVEGYHA